MTVVKTYIAEDGKKFDDEWECVEYERELKSNQFKDVAFLFDDEGHQLPLTDAGFEDCMFIVCKTDEAAAYMYNEFCTGYFLPWGCADEAKAGMWISINDNWRELEEFLPLAKVAIKISES